MSLKDSFRSLNLRYKWAEVRASYHGEDLTGALLDVMIFVGLSKTLSSVMYPAGNNNILFLVKCSSIFVFIYNTQFSLIIDLRISLNTKVLQLMWRCRENIGYALVKVVEEEEKEVAETKPLPGIVNWFWKSAPFKISSLYPVMVWFQQLPFPLLLLPLPMHTQYPLCVYMMLKFIGPN